MLNFRESIGAIATIELRPDFREELHTILPMNSEMTSIAADQKSVERESNVETES